MSWVREFVGMAFDWRRENWKLRNALERLLKDYDPEAQCILVEPDAGCIECTCGATPNNLNTGLCAYHEALRLLGRL